MISFVSNALFDVLGEKLLKSFSQRYADLELYYYYMFIWCYITLASLHCLWREVGPLYPVNFSGIKPAVVVNQFAKLSHLSVSICFVNLICVFLQIVKNNSTQKFKLLTPLPDINSSLWIVT